MSESKIIAAYKKLFNKEPEAETEEWRLAQKIVSHWNVPKLGEELALETLFEILNHTDYPDTETTHRIVGRAENLISEFLPELSEHDAHMDVIEFLERKYYKEKEAKKEKEKEENKELRKEKKII
ncbi:MAG: hypothetical protein ACOZAL_00410 [Patescibacteria group bacterium]